MGAGAEAKGVSVMAGPKLNDGKIYVVTSSGGTHLGDYRTFAEALARAREYGAIGGVDRGLSGAHYSTPDGGLITIAVEFVDPLYRVKS
jgi:hypothetical protein